ncbi:MAG: AraC family transcriptional regulator ligand-binding domain-containing protein [Oleiphilaceae bacterium]|nr:AraC family transcriptional regulator ligand-binding domain-containing protein [Oleiphilaceae bacterium]
MEKVFRGNTLSWEKLLETNRFINFEQFSRIGLNAMALTQCPWLGLEISTMIQVSAHGPMGYGAVAAQTVRQAFKLVERTMATRIRIYDFKLDEVDGRARFTLRELLDPGELREFIYVMLLGSFQDMLAKTSGTHTTDICVHFPFEEPPWSNLYAERFPGLEIGFDYEHFTIDMPAALLDLHCLTADEFAYRNAVRECEQLLAVQNQGGDLAEQIKRRLLDQGAPYPVLQEMSEMLGISSRTLIRKLKQEHTSYQMLLDEVRQELACWYLQNSDSSIEDIADRLGFIDTSNFSRVFRRWLGCTPSQFRKSS